MWEKYKIGESFKIIDPETKAPAVKNPFLIPKPGVLATDDMAVDRLLGKGAVFGACNVALHALSKRLAKQRRRERGRGGKGMGREPGAGNHSPPIGGVGSEPRAGSRLHLLHGRLKTSCGRT